MQLTPFEEARLRLNKIGSEMDAKVKALERFNSGKGYDARHSAVQDSTLFAKMEGDVALAQDLLAELGSSKGPASRHDRARWHPKIIEGEWKVVAPEEADHGYESS